MRLLGKAHTHTYLEELSSVRGLQTAAGILARDTRFDTADGVVTVLGDFCARKEVESERDRVAIEMRNGHRLDYVN